MTSPPAKHPRKQGVERTSVATYRTVRLQDSASPADRRESCRALLVKMFSRPKRDRSTIERGNHTVQRKIQALRDWGGFGSPSGGPPSVCVTESDHRIRSPDRSFLKLPGQTALPQLPQRTESPVLTWSRRTHGGPEARRSMPESSSLTRLCLDFGLNRTEIAGEPVTREETAMSSSNKYSPEVRERAVRMVLEHQSTHDSQWAAIGSSAEKIGCASETFRYP